MTCLFSFFFNDTATTAIYTLSLHDALPICGMRVVRSFSRQQAEAATFTRNGHLMARQEIFAWWWMRGVELAWSVLIPVASALLLYFGGMRVLADMDKVRAGLIAPKDALTVGDLVMFLA